MSHAAAAAKWAAIQPAPLKPYQVAAERHKAADPDGWYVDPEAVLAWEEGLYAWPTAELLPDWEEILRGRWRQAQAGWLKSGADFYAAEMVAVEGLHKAIVARLHNARGAAAIAASSSRFD